ncbi:pyruvate, phosphate dikinase, partial [bacterium]|nr:pyruvate, phosphate dikinase [bacterium]
LQSSNPNSRKQAENKDLHFIYKNSPNLLAELRDFFQANLGFGSFIFRDTHGAYIAEAHNMREFGKMLQVIPDESILFHASFHNFSTWFMAKGEIELAVKLKTIKSDDFIEKDKSAVIRNYILDTLKQRRLEKKQDSIANFSSSMFHDEYGLMRLADGSVGGKGRGVAFVDNLLRRTPFEELLPDINVRIPKSAIIGTDEFDAFIEQVELEDIALEEYSSKQIRHIFKMTHLSEDLIGRLKQLVEETHLPLAVRSSGLFEDSLSQPFAGVYETYFIPNNHPDVAVRLRHLQTAIKMVYASVFTPLARSYFDSVNYNIEEEKMAVIIQEIVGSQHERFFYPHISGVAQSYNYYPFNHMKAEEGIALMAIGLGKIVVEGEQTFRFSPKYPRTKVETIDMLFKNAQRTFYALDVGNYTPNLLEGESVSLVKLDISEAERFGTIDYCASVFDSSSQTLRPGLHTSGPRLITFSHILEYDYIPLAPAIDSVLNIMSRAFGTPVEIEFSVDLNKDEQGRASLYLLQVKPLIQNSEYIDIDISTFGDELLFLKTSKGMGNGIVEGLRDVVFVKMEKFSAFKTDEMAREIAEINKRMKEQDSHYLLVGPGRWGSSDSLLGIPVNWSHISQAKIIVEAGLEGFHVDASLGSHFFHNITSLDIGYFTVPLFDDHSFIDWDWLKNQEIIEDGEFVMHIRAKEPFSVLMDGKQQKAIITKEEIITLANASE